MPEAEEVTMEDVFRLYQRKWLCLAQKEKLLVPVTRACLLVIGARFAGQTGVV